MRTRTTAEAGTTTLAQVGRCCCVTAAPVGGPTSSAIICTRVVGHLNWVEASHFRDVLSLQEGSNLVLDLSGASTDSAGTGAVLNAVLRATRSRQKVVVVASGTLSQVLDDVGLATLAPVVSSVSEAVDWLQAH